MNCSIQDTISLPGIIENIWFFDIIRIYLAIIKKFTDVITFTFKWIKDIIKIYKIANNTIATTTVITCIRIGSSTPIAVVAVMGVVVVGGGGGGGGVTVGCCWIQTKL